MPVGPTSTGTARRAHSPPSRRGQAGGGDGGDDEQADAAQDGLPARRREAPSLGVDGFQIYARCIVTAVENSLQPLDVT